MMRETWALALVLLGACGAQAFAPAKPQGLRVRGAEIVTPDGKPIRLIGFNVMWWTPSTADDARQIRAMGCNMVRYMFGYVPQGKFDPSKLDFVKEQVRYFTSRGLWVIPVVHDFRKDGKGPYDDPALNREFLEMWAWVFGQLKDDPFVAAWEPINEPHDSPVEKVAPWYRKVTAQFRKWDAARPIVVEGTGYSWPEGLVDAIKMRDRNVIYAFHTYGPFEYTHQEEGKDIPYPGKWSREDLRKAIEPAARFRAKHNVPVWCGEWGVMTRNPGYTQWIHDVASILEEYRFPWTYWGYAYIKDHPLNPSFDVNPQKKEVFELMKTIVKQAKR